MSAAADSKPQLVFEPAAKKEKKSSTFNPHMPSELATTMAANKDFDSKPHESEPAAAAASSSKKRKADLVLAKQDKIVAASRASDKEKNKVPYTFVPGVDLIDFTEVAKQQQLFDDAEDAAEKKKTKKQKVAKSEDGEEEEQVKAKKPRAKSTINKSLATQIALFDKKIDRFFPDMDRVPVLIAPMWMELQEFWDESKYMITLITGRIQPNLNFSGDMESDRTKMHRVYSAFVNFRQHTKRLQAVIAESKA